ncbi:hypothetical protein TUM4261_29100 [Shewanella sp. c952]|uniref:DUF333 domain-containing protein n=1 Tax=Shewanella sp. c952 TaxID=2815913 RepID=UPI001BBCB940|nr:DUF333 domain-containing protein [Shewanella sp. c952]GIU14071.1 hypothetical protein TUM4261_29100 [Shewanella sp. c952]
MKSPLLVSLLTCSALLLTACDSQSNEPAASKVNLANPASTYCIEQGGTVKIENQAEGQVGYCTLASGERIEEWQLYRQSQQNSQQDSTQDKTEQVGKANPASKYCISMNGKLDLTSGQCTLPSGEVIDQWQLFKRDHKQETEVTEMQKMPNPATQYCIEVGGSVDLSDGSCTLPNGDKVDQWKLYKKHQLMSI